MSHFSRPFHFWSQSMLHFTPPISKTKPIITLSALQWQFERKFPIPNVQHWRQESTLSYPGSASQRVKIINRIIRERQRQTFDFSLCINLNECNESAHKLCAFTSKRLELYASNETQTIRHEPWAKIQFHSASNWHKRKPLVIFQPIYIVL